MSDEVNMKHLCGTHSILRVAKWHLDEIGRTPAAKDIESIEYARTVADHADVVTVFSAATVEARLNDFVASPLLFMREEGPRRFLAELVTKHLRLRIPDKLKFLRDRVPALKGNTLLPKVRDLCNRRNRILHTSLEYEEVKSLPTQPYVPGLHDHLPESSLVQRPRLSSKRSFPIPPLEQAQADYATACEFLKLMYHVIPYEPWPPPDFET